MYVYMYVYTYIHIYIYTYIYIYIHTHKRTHTNTQTHTHTHTHTHKHTQNRVALEALGWTMTRGDGVVESAGGRRRRITVINRYSFASSLARMATLVELVDKGVSKVLVLAKGAPETMLTR